MRLSLVVLAAVITLVSRCTAVSAASSTSQINLSNLNQALDTMQNHAGDGNRFLRSANIVDGNDDDIDRHDEERGGNFLANQFAKLRGKIWNREFAKWHKGGESAEDVYKKLKLEPIVRKAYDTKQIGRLKQQKDYRKWLAYSEFLKKKQNGIN